jgi:hypothetical protein
VTVDANDLRLAGAFALAGGVVLPLLPGDAGVPCPLRTFTGIPCPLCGMTTSVVETVRLDLADAFAANPGGIALVAVAVALLVLRPREVRLPAPLLYLGLLSLWMFELERFSVL